MEIWRVKLTSTQVVVEVEVEVGVELSKNEIDIYVYGEVTRVLRDFEIFLC